MADDHSEHDRRFNFPSLPPILVRRSKRRTKTVSARVDGNHTLIDIPARFTSAEEMEWIERMVERLEAKQAPKHRSDDELLKKAKKLSKKYLDGAAKPKSVRWVTNQNSRWGSCTPADAAVRLSNRLQPFPKWVQDYVLLHELAHLIEPQHNEHFWSLVSAYPRHERARGFLEGYTHATSGKK